MQKIIQRNGCECTQRHKCVQCNKLLIGFKEQKTDLWGYVECISCKEYVDAATHKYFIQVAKSPEEEQTKKKKKKKKEEDEEEVRCECWSGNVGSKW